MHPGAPRVGCILNGRGRAAPPDRRRSRGDLPLRAAAEGPQALKELHQDPDTLARYDPFYLVCADQHSCCCSAGTAATPRSPTWAPAPTC